MDKDAYFVTKVRIDKLHDMFFRFSEKAVSIILDKILGNCNSKFNLNKLTDNFINPVLNSIGALPKDELANMAESLIHITSLKRKIASDLETVGGDIDVSIISKGDGFIWKRRKHYFDAELNPQFFKK